VTASTNQGLETAPRSASSEFFSLLVQTVVGTAVGAAMFVGFAGLVFGLSARSLLVPFVALIVPGPILAPFLYWARLARDRPKAFALRFAIGAFAQLQVLATALLFSAIWTGIASPTTVVEDIVPILFPFLIFLTPIIYLGVHSMSKDWHRR
jgi:hypothetical protein